MDDNKMDEDENGLRTTQLAHAQAMNFVLKNRIKQQTDLLATYIAAFNQNIAPELKYDPINHTKHRELLKLLDNKLIQTFMETANVADKCRLNAVSVNGANAWITAPPNTWAGVEYSNQEFWILQCLHLGSKITPQNINCMRCKSIMDPYGWHALHCPFGGDVIRRHNDLRNIIAALFRQAGYVVTIEQRFDLTALVRKQQQLGKAVDVSQVEVKGIPGDMKVHEYEDGHDWYFDVSVVNVMAESYRQQASEQRLYAASSREKSKYDKYKNVPHFKPLVIESMGGIGLVLKEVLKECASRLSVRNNVPYSVSMHRIRQRLISKLMLHNARMVISSMRMGL